jgi:hypothetical protein
LLRGVSPVAEWSGSAAGGRRRPVGPAVLTLKPTADSTLMS